MTIAKAVSQRLRSRRSSAQHLPAHAQRSASSVPPRVMTISRNPRADPYGQSRPLVKMTWTILAIVVVWAPPSRSGVT